jgi:cytochrome b561
LSETAAPKGYSQLQILLHWTIAALVIFQLIVNRGMQDAFDDMMDGDQVGDLGWAVLHIGVGITILALAIVRVVVRLKRGAPAAHVSNPPVMNLIAYRRHRLVRPQ